MMQPEPASTLMKQGRGEWVGPGKQKQLRFMALYSDDWADYRLKRQSAVRKIIGPRSSTINQPLLREAEEAYNICRKIMREDAS